jgi:hypothetical protein
MAMYSQSGGKCSTHAWLSDTTNISAIPYLVVQTYEYTYYRNFRTIHQRNAALHVGTYALLPSDRFLRTLIATPTLNQDGQMLNLDDTEIQVFNQLQAKLQDVLKAIRAIVGARKKGRGKSGEANNPDGMDVE